MLIVLSGVSGVGKTTLAQELLKNGKYKKPISYTSREKRAQEEHGKDYFFISKEEFREKMEQNFFLEHVTHFEHHYGTSYDEISSILKNNERALLCLCPDGFAALKQKWGSKVLGFYLLPPKFEELEARLALRNASDHAKRMQSLKNDIEKYEKRKHIYDHQVRSGILSEVLSLIQSIIDKY
jgi:guanylate kinase